MGELGDMRNARRLWTVVFAVTAAVLTVAAARPVGAEVVAVEPLQRLAQRAGLRVLEGRHLVLATDRPVRKGDGVEELPAVVDQAFAAWCHHYGMDPAAHADWRCFGCLVVDPERFRAAGLLPDSVPRLENGFCPDNRFWLRDQSNPAYRRHLLLHEAAHAFTLTLRGLATPVWYNEGVAEFLATHRLEPAGDGIRFVHTPIPDRPADVEQLGRIEKIRDLWAVGRAPGLEDVLGLTVSEHGSIADYAASWAAVAMLASHPALAKAFTSLERGPLGPDFNGRLEAIPGWDAARVTRDFDAFTADLDYGWDFNRMAIDWSPGEPPAHEPRTFAVDATRGWQNSGIRLAAGGRYRYAAAGRVGVGSVTDEASGRVTPLESEPEGISLEWYRGRPVGRLLAGQWVAPADGSRPRFEVVSEGVSGRFAAPAAGPLYFKVNQAPGRLADDAGSFRVELQPLAAGE